MNDPQPPWYSLPQAARLVGVSTNVLRRWMAVGRLVGHGVVYFSQADPQRIVAADVERFKADCREAERAAFGEVGTVAGGR